MTTSPASGSSAGDSAAFDLLDPRVRRWVWDQAWTELHDAQEEAIPLILAGTEDVIVSAATAGGKTEAAFLPICTRLGAVPEAEHGVRVLYISPLKALINDQYDRLERLCERVDAPVHRWHGDVTAGARQRLLRDPAGVLLITPESLEAWFVLRGHEVRRLLAPLMYVVVDELHAFVGSERGRQVQSLLHRVEAAIGRRVPRIGLSATLGDMSIAADFLRPEEDGGGGERVRVIVSREGGQELRLQLRGYRSAPPPIDGADDEQDEDGSDPPSEEIAIRDHLFRSLRGGHHLIFANRRADVERYADLLRRRSEEERVPNEFWPHHGSLSRELRLDVEAMLKDHTRPVSVVCTTTLEMGIDIGDLESIAQLGAPPSVAAMRQRLGRSGRRGGAAVMRLYITEPVLTPQTPLPDALRGELVQAAAMVNLLAAGWYEPPRAGALHLSTLVQQLLSLIAERGGVRPLGAWDLLCGTGPFDPVDQTTFGELLRALAERDLIAQASDGDLIPAPAGERLINHYTFYTAFVTQEEYRLIAGDRTLGMLPVSYPLMEGALIVFAGRRWRVLEVDERRRTIEVAPAAGGRPPRFVGGVAPVHDRVRGEMLAVLSGDAVPPFLDATARDLLSEGRETFRRGRLSTRRLVPTGRDTLIFPWTGDLAMDTLAVQLTSRGLAVARDGLAITVSRAEPGEVWTHLAAIAANGPADGVTLARAVANKIVEKYDSLLTPDLLCATHASRALDPEGAWRAARAIVEAGDE